VCAASDRPGSTSDAYSSSGSIGQQSSSLTYPNVTTRIPLATCSQGVAAQPFPGCNRYNGLCAHFLNAKTVRKRQRTDKQFGNARRVSGGCYAAFNGRYFSRSRWPAIRGRMQLLWPENFKATAVLVTFARGCSDRCANSILPSSSGVPIISLRIYLASGLLAEGLR
jgi:hypothetical protein